jgi:hypothetical protein
MNKKWPAYCPPQSFLLFVMFFKETDNGIVFPGEPQRHPMPCHKKE